MKRLEDHERCIAKIPVKGSFMLRYHQCSKRAVMGQYCKLHAPETLAAKRQARDDELERRSKFMREQTMRLAIGACVMETVREKLPHVLPETVEQWLLCYATAQGLDAAVKNAAVRKPARPRKPLIELFRDGQQNWIMQTTDVDGTQNQPVMPGWLHWSTKGVVARRLIAQRYPGCKVALRATAQAGPVAP